LIEMPVFFIEPEALQDDGITVIGSLAHHLIDSLRVQPGEQLWLGLNHGSRFRGRVLHTEPGRLTAKILFTSTPPTPSCPAITVGLGLIKNEHMDWAIQKATELGVTRLVPLTTTRSVIRVPAERIPHRTARWQTIAHEAAQQSMRWEIPEVTAPVSLDEWCGRERETACRLLLWENPQGSPLGESLRGKPCPGSIAMGIGPEGGFDAQEVIQAEHYGFEKVSLGSRILRTESALLTALAIIQYEWGDVG
jgi:16S rRNA (uracil1498-N3)-methyltransferase